MTTPKTTDAHGVEILPTDTVRVTAWGGRVRLSDVGTVSAVKGFTARGNVKVTLDGREVAAWGSMLSVARRDGLSGHEGNVGTSYDSHAR